MFNVDASEFLLVAFVALIVIGPKDLPKAMRVVGYWVGKARGVARQFRSGFDSMVREAELEEMEKRWASENERIMREHPQTATVDQDHSTEAHSPETYAVENGASLEDHTADPVMVEKPVVAAAETSRVGGDHPAGIKSVATKPATDQGPDLFDATAHSTPGAAPVADDKTGKSDVASS